MSEIEENLANISPERAAEILNALSAAESRMAEMLSSARLQMDKAWLACATAEAAAKKIQSSVRAPAIPGFDTALMESDSLALGEKVVALHIGDGPGSEYHVDLWLPFMRRAGKEALVITRSHAVFRSLQTRTDLDVVFVREGRDAETVMELCPNLRAVLYVSNTGNTIHFLRMNQLKHVFVGHGDSEKSASCHKFFRAYDEIWTAGQAHIDRFKNSGIDFRGLEFVLIGRPLSKDLLSSGSAEAFGKFLYLPTWEGFHDEQGYSSVEIGVSLAAAVSEITGKTPIVKFHPWTGKQNKELVDSESLYSRAFEEAHTTAEVLGRFVPAVDSMPTADFLIADVSSVVTDFLTVQRPIFLYSPDDQKIKIAGSQMPYSEYCYQFSDSETLVRLVKEVIIDGNDRLADARRRALNYFIDVDATLNDRFATELDRVTQPSNTVPSGA